MTYEQYWYGDPFMVVSYRKADKLRQEQSNSMAWLQGMYIYDAFLRISPLLQAFAKKGTKAEPYVNKPYPIFGEREETEAEKELREEQEALQAKLYMENMVRAGKNWGKH